MLIEPARLGLIEIPEAIAKLLQTTAYQTAKNAKNAKKKKKEKLF